MIMGEVGDVGRSRWEWKRKGILRTSCEPISVSWLGSPNFAATSSEALPHMQLGTTPAAAGEASMLRLTHWTLPEAQQAAQPSPKSLDFGAPGPSDNLAKWLELPPLHREYFLIIYGSILRVPLLWTTHWRDFVVKSCWLITACKSTMIILRIQTCHVIHFPQLVAYHILPSSLPHLDSPPLVIPGAFQEILE